MHKKRLLTILLVVCMVLSCLAPAASAAPAPSQNAHATDTTSTGNVRRDDSKNVISGSESSQKPTDAASAGSREDADALLAALTGDSSWLAERVDASVDLTGANHCIEELEALAEQYEPNEKVAAFVILDDAPLAETYSSKRQVPASVLAEYEKKQKTVIETIEKNFDSVDVVCTFNYLTNAVVIETDFANLSKIAALEGVASVFVSPVFYPAATTDADQMTVTSGQMTNVDDVWNLSGTGYTGAGMTVAILDTGLDLDHPSFAADPELTDASWTKESVQAMLDSVDGLNAVARYSGTLTAADLYYNAKVPFRFNYAMGTTSVTHNDSLGDHGTHVAGIAAANEVEGTGVVGMAPDAQIIAMKVFNSTTGGANLYDFVAALEDCILLDVDVANLSLGSAAGFSVSSYAEIDAIFDRIAGTGLVVNIAAGNDGTSANGSLYGESMALTGTIDNSTVASPSTYSNVLSIGSVDNAYVMADYFVFGEEDTKVFYQNCVEYLYEYTDIGLQEMLAEQTLDYVIIDGLGEEADFYDAEGNSLVSGKVAVVKRGSINFSLKVANAENAGAVAVLVWNNVSEDIFSFGMSVEDPDTGAYPGIPAIFISLEDGQKMADAENKTLTVVTDPALRINSTGGQISSFSSWGASADLRLLPDLSGVGGNVYSCYDGGVYGLMSGTSMATPQVSGVSALVKQYLEGKGMASNEIVAALMMSTANVIVDSVSGVETSPRQQGAGLVDALKAVTAEAYLTVDGGRPKAELGDSADGTYSFTFEIHNFSDASKTYTLSGSLLCEDYVDSAYYEGISYMAGYDTALDGQFSFSKNTVTVASGATASITVRIRLTEDGKNWIREHFENGNYVEGYVYLTDTAEEGGVDLSLPFMGFFGDWSDAPIFDEGFWYDNSFWAANVEGVNNTISGEEYWNVLWLNMGSSNNDWILGLNPYAGAMVDENGDVIYSSENNVITPNGDGIMDNISDYYLSLLRNCRYVWLTYTDEEGNVLDRQTLEYESKTMYNSSYGATVPSVYTWYYNTDDLYDFTDADGNYLPDGTKVTLTISAVIDYDLDEKISVDENGNVIPVNPDDSISIPMTVDTVAPVMDTTKIVETSDENGRYLTITITEAHPATAALMNPAGTQIYDQIFDTDMVKNDDGTWSATLDITDRGDEFMVILGDYGYNETHYQVHRSEVGGNDPELDLDSVYAYQVYNLNLYYYYGWDYMFGWTELDPEEGTLEMISSDAYEYYAINAAEYVDGYVFAIDAGGNFLYMIPGLWNRNTIRNIGYNVVDMAFDDVTDTMYITISDTDSDTYALATLDLMTGEVNILRDYYSKYSMPWALTFVNGELYCCKYYYGGFYRVDFENYYNITAVTDAEGNAFRPMTTAGYETSPYYGQSMTYSKKDCKIYWFYCDSESMSELITIDPTAWTSTAESLGSTEYVAAITLEDTNYRIPSSEKITGLALNEEERFVAVGSTTQVEVYTLPWNAPAGTIVWTTDNADVVSVTDGKITALSAGEATVTATCGDASTECFVKVIDTSGLVFGYDYSGDGTYGYWQGINLATMEPTNCLYSEVEFLAADYNGHDGYIYGYDSTDSCQSWKLNTDTGEVTKLQGTGYVLDMAYDYSTGIMYAIMSNSTELYAMNMHTGDLVTVVDTGHYLAFGTLACDLEGNLYAIDIAGTLWQLSLYETEAGEDGGDDGGIGGWEPLHRALETYEDDFIDDDFGIDEEPSETMLAVEMTYIMDLDVSVYDYLYYGQSMCYDYRNDVLIWCYTDGDTFRRIDLNEGLVFDLGPTTTHTMPQYFGLFTIPDEIPELEPVVAEGIVAEDMFLLVGAESEPSIQAEPINVNQPYTLVCEVVSNLADDGTDSVVAEFVDGKIVAKQAGTAYVDVYALDENEEVLAYSYFRVVVKNATSSKIRLYMGDSDYWVDVDPFNTDNLTPYGNAMYEDSAYFMYSAEYVDTTGYIYGYGFDQTAWTTDFKFIVFEPQTMSAVSLTSMGDEFPFVYDLAYDYTTATMYALAGTNEVVALYYVDLQTGKLIKACSLDQMYLNMAIDAEGTIYLMTRSESSYIDLVESSSAQLYTVDEKTGECTYLLDTGVNSPYLSSLSYDYDTGYLFWTPYEALYLIDVNDYTVNKVGDLVSQNEALMLLADNYPATPTSLTDAVLTTELAELYEGESLELSLFVKPSSVKATTTWFSADDSVATVDENGVVTGVSSGVTTVSALVADGREYILANCTIYVYGENDYFLSYNATDKGFSAIDRLDPSKVTNLTEGETAPAVTAMVEIDGVIYGYDENGTLFKTDLQSGFVRTEIGSCGIDASAYSTVIESSYECSTYTAKFLVRDMAVYEGRVLALGVVAYDVHSDYYWNGEISYSDDWSSEMEGGCGLYEVDLQTGALTKLCTIYGEDGDYMSGAKMISFDAKGNAYVYTTYNDFISFLNIEDGSTNFITTLQSLSVYGDEASSMGMTYDAATNSLYLLVTTGGSYYRLFKLPLDTCVIGEVGTVGEVTYADWSYNGDLFQGLLVRSEAEGSLHVHAYEKTYQAPSCAEEGYVKFSCNCGDVLYEAVLPASHAWDNGTVNTEPTCAEDGEIVYTCTECGETKTEALPATGHRYTTSVVEATCTEAGYTVHTCSVCGDTYYTDLVQPTGHDYVMSITEPTCEEEGYMTLTCSVCGETHSVAYAELIGHNYVDGTCTNCGDELDHCYYADFTDCVDEWYHEAVDFTVANGLMNGVGHNKFDPSGTLTRAMAVTVLYRMAGCPTVFESATFTDFPEGEWYSEAVAWAQVNGIVLGVTETEFRPNEPITREQIVTILCRYNGKILSGSDLEAFNDADQVSEYAFEAICWAVGNGILKGDNKGNLNPLKSATRVEFATMIMRYLGGSYDCGK